MTNEESRRASGAAMEANRRASGANMESSRRASGAAMIERRTGKSVVDDVNSIVNPTRESRPLPPVDPVGALLPQRGTGVYQAPPATSGGGGIASPLVEKSRSQDGKLVPDVTWWPQGMTSSDGLFVLPAPSIRRFTDSNGDDVELYFVNPEGSA